MAAQEFEKTPVTPGQLQPARYFAASYAGEHVAGTEFVIGAMFVAWGVPTMDILWGLLWGNLLAVLTWGLVCAPIATDTRLNRDVAVKILPTGLTQNPERAARFQLPNKGVQSRSAPAGILMFSNDLAFNPLQNRSTKMLHLGVDRGVDQKL